MLGVGKESLLFPPTKGKTGEFQLLPGVAWGPRQGASPSTQWVLSWWRTGVNDSFLCSSYLPLRKEKYSTGGLQIAKRRAATGGSPSTVWDPLGLRVLGAGEKEFLVRLMKAFNRGLLFLNNQPLSQPLTRCFCSQDRGCLNLWVLGNELRIHNRNCTGIAQLYKIGLERSPLLSSQILSLLGPSLPAKILDFSPRSQGSWLVGALCWFEAVMIPLSSTDNWL